MKRILVAGNWKMHKLTSEARELAAELASRLSGLDDATGVLLCPPFTALAEVAAAVSGTGILLGAQNMFWEEKGAYTGEISPQMLKDIGCSHVIIGHSERRQYFGETDYLVNEKVHAALKAGLTPVVCVGETEQQRDRKVFKRVIAGQVRMGLAGLTAKQVKNIVIAYEPVWAIGTGRNATPGQAQAVHALIREQIAEAFGKRAASSLLILYGGSVKPDNAARLMSKPDICGALVGGASLDADSFEKIIRKSEAAASK